MELFKSLRLFVIGILKRIYWILPTLVLDPFDFIERLLNVNYDVPLWAIWTLFTIGWMIAIVLTYHELRMQKVALEKPINWIDAHKKKHRKLPQVPDHLEDVVVGYYPGMLVSKEIELVIPSVQFWNRLLPSQKDQFLELAKWLGYDPRDYIAEMERRAPPGLT